MNKIQELIAEYERLAEKYQKIRKDADNRQFGIIYDETHKILWELTQLDNRFLINAIQKYHQTDEIGHLSILVEFCRAMGILYQEVDETAELLEVLLKIALDLIRNPIIFQDRIPMWIVSLVYDIIFHQVRWQDYPSHFADKYFELSFELLNEKFHPFYKENKIIPKYSTCIYFIDMAVHWFATREDEFLVLWYKMKKLDDSLIEEWQEYYEEIIETMMINLIYKILIINYL